MLHASALAISWRSAFFSLFPQPRDPVYPSTPFGADIPRQSPDADEEREAFHLDDMEIASRLVKPRGPGYETPSHAQRIVPSRPVR